MAKKAESTNSRSEKQKSVQLYNLDQFRAYAGGDPENFHQIIVLFINSGLKNVAFFRQSLHEKNTTAISELAHKMLPLFRMLQTNNIVELLNQLEQKDPENINHEVYFSMGKSALGKIEEVLQIIQEEENID